jgi:hypothetical protein
MKSSSFASTVAFAGLGLIAQCSAQAGEVYGGIGFPGIFAGYAQPVMAQVVLRADYATLGQYAKDGEEDGVTYKGKVKVGRLGVFADYFPWGGRSGFRVTGGLTFNQIKVDLKSNFTGTPVAIGDQASVTPNATDRFNVTVKVPDVTPFLGVGYGHEPATGKGWGFHVDLGASIGRAKVSVDTNLIGQYGVTAADVDKELAQLRDGVGKVRFVPQISFGLSYRF